MYSFALFVHIVGAVLLFVLLTIEGAALPAGFSTCNVNRILGPISALAFLLPGLYMMAMGPGWKAWVAVGFATLLLIAVLGAATGISVVSGRMNNRAAM